MPLLGLNPDLVSYASDYFGPMIGDATLLIKAGFLYADETPVELVSGMLRFKLILKAARV